MKCKMTASGKHYFNTTTINYAEWKSGERDYYKKDDDDPDCDGVYDAIIIEKCIICGFIDDRKPL